MTATLRMADATLRELLRRRGVLGLLLLVPLVFYLGRYDQTGQAVRFASLGVGFAVSAAALFSTVGGREIEPLLALSGFRPLQLFAGRLLALLAAGLGVSALYAVVVLVGQDLAHPRAVLLELRALPRTGRRRPGAAAGGGACTRDMRGRRAAHLRHRRPDVMHPAKRSAGCQPFRRPGEPTRTPDGAGAFARPLRGGPPPSAATLLLTMRAAV
ncbi:ABC transporter permease OS=Streptomyces fumanus OX=67302 GN=GCM10018772_35130 PE=4 SV=1 [Streptomyces fumanus]